MPRSIWPVSGGTTSPSMSSTAAGMPASIRRMLTVSESIQGGDVHCRISRGGRLEDRKGVNVPGEALSRTSSMGPADREDLLFAIDHEVDYIAASFVRTAADVLEIRKVLDERGAQIPIIAKIENPEGVQNLDEID